MENNIIDSSFKDEKEFISTEKDKHFEMFLMF